MNGYVSRIKNEDKLFYSACPNQDCRRKVSEETGGYKCEHCNKFYPDCTPTYMVTAKISDFTDAIYVNFARENGESIIGLSAREWKEKREGMDEEEVQGFFDRLLFRKMNLMVKGKYEQF